MAEIEQEFIEYVVKALVASPEAVKVNRSVDDAGVLLELSVDSADIGKVIGRAGATAKSLRKLLGVLGAKHDQRVSLKIVEPEGSTYSHEPSTQHEPAIETPEPVVEVAEIDPEKESRAKLKKEVEELADFEI